MGVGLTLRVMAATPNRAAAGLLENALASHDRAVRVGACKAMAARNDRDSHNQLLMTLPDCESDVQAASHDAKISDLLRAAVNSALVGEDERLCQRACRYAVDSDDFHVLPSIVEATLKPNQPNLVSLAAATLRLSNTLAQLADMRPEQRPAGCGDPAFARHAALKSLAIGVDRFSQHHRLEQIDAFLMLTTPDNAVLTRVLFDASHAAHEPMFAALEKSAVLGALDVLIHATENTETSQRLLELAARRSDLRYLARLFTRLGPTLGLRAVENAKRLTGFGWATTEKLPSLLRLDENNQTTAMRLVTAAACGKELRVELAEFLLTHGGEEARVAACETLRRMQDAKIGMLLGTALKDESPRVVAAAAIQLRRHQHPDALMQLVSLLSHSSAEVVRAAQDSLVEFSFKHYRDIYRKLSAEQRSLVGRLVGKADPKAVDSVRADLQSPAVERRLSALDLISEMAVVDRLLEEVLETLRDKDAGVRSEAARILAASEDPAAVEALADALIDRNVGVRTAAETSLRKMQPLDVVEGLLRAIEENCDEK